MAEIQAIKDAEVAAAEAELKRQEGRKRREVRSHFFGVAACVVFADSQVQSLCPETCHAAQPGMKQQLG